MLTSHGFEQVYNLSGGIKAWKKEVAVGAEDTGLRVFAEDLQVEQAIITGFGLEMGLGNFYLSQRQKVSSETVRDLFTRLADIEVLHQQQLLELYKQVTEQQDVTLKSFAEQVVAPEMEGGLTTDEYLALYDIDAESEEDVLGLAMAIEAQALDLYLRAAEGAKTGEVREILLHIAREERVHMQKLSHFIDNQRS